MSCPEVIVVEENQKKSSGKATASLILGIISLVAWLLPLIGYPVSIVGLCLGISNVKKEKDTFSKVGIILSAIGLGITAINSIAGVIIALKQL